MYLCIVKPKVTMQVLNYGKTDIQRFIVLEGARGPQTINTAWRKTGGENLYSETIWREGVWRSGVY